MLYSISNSQWTVSVHQFDFDTQVTQTANNLWTGTIDPAWNIGDNPNGGYLLSCVIAALKQVMPHPDPVTLTTHYLRPGIPGAPFEVFVEIIRTGRTLSSARARLSQDGKPRLEVLGTFGDLAVSAGIDFMLTVLPPPIPPPEACIQRTGDAQGIGLPIGDRLDVRLHPDYAVAGAAGDAKTAGWIRFLDGRAPDTTSLPLFTDTFPPSPFGLLGAVGWVPTIELTVHIRRQPADGWIQAEFETEDLQQGRMLESGHLWDSEGHLVAQSRQLGLVLQQD